MSERGPLAIVEGRHPLMEQLQGCQTPLCPMTHTWRVMLCTVPLQSLLFPFAQNSE